jgi:hypothetical protein
MEVLSIPIPGSLLRIVIYIWNTGKPRKLRGQGTSSFTERADKGRPILRLTQISERGFIIGTPLPNPCPRIAWALTNVNMG